MGCSRAAAVVSTNGSNTGQGGAGLVARTLNWPPTRGEGVAVWDACTALFNDRCVRTRFCESYVNRLGDDAIDKSKTSKGGAARQVGVGKGQLRLTRAMTKTGRRLKRGLGILVVGLGIGSSYGRASVIVCKSDDVLMRVPV